MRASTKLCRISAFVVSEVKVEGGKLGNFWMGREGKSDLEDEGQCELGEGNNREYGEGHQATRVHHGARQKLALPVAQLTALDQLPEQAAPRVHLAPVQLRARPDVRDARMQCMQCMMRSTLRLRVETCT